MPIRVFPGAAGLRGAILALAVLALVAVPVRASEPDTTASRRSLYPIPILFYTPETGLAGGASLLYLFGGEGAESAGRPSSLSTLGIYTGKKQTILGVGGDLQLEGGATQLSGGVFYMNFPSEFYGVGNGTPESAQESYTPREFEATLRAVRRVRGRLQIGATALAQRLELRETEEDRSLDRGEVPGAEGGWAMGLGLLAGADTRDAIYSARRGVFAEIGVDVHDAVLGSDFGFTRWRADLRRYHPLFGDHVLAVRTLAVFTLGDPPFHLMPQLGGAELLRGYYEGRFRDRELVAAQAEYRFPVYGPVTMAVFASAGQVARRASDLQAGAFHWAGGFGFRYLLSRDSRLVLRVDQGFGEEGGGFYFSFGEAF